MQYELIKRLKGADSNLFLVGDPNQAIYSWRGAVTEYLNSRFDKDFNHQTVFHNLEHNHRCVFYEGLFRDAHTAMSRGTVTVNVTL